jgi:ribosomal small subunit protein bTHX
MGKGDRKSRRGKIFMGSFGVSRKRKKSKKATFVAKTVNTEIKMTSKPIPLPKVKEEVKIVEEVVNQEQVIVEPKLTIPEVKAEEVKSEEIKSEEIKTEDVVDTPKKPKAKSKPAAKKETEKKEKTEKKEPAKKKAPKKEKE